MNKKRWSEQEVNYVISFYPEIGASGCAKALGRSRMAVIHKAIRMNVVMNEEDKIKIFSSMGRKNCQDQKREKNNNWKGGISKNNYHYKKLQKEKYPERVQARESVRRAIKRGSLKRFPCQICGSINSNAHHNDYTKPLDVVWLCRKHHRELHSKK